MGTKLSSKLNLGAYVFSLCDAKYNDIEREVLLWDFAGQPDYRLVHTLFLDEADAALVLFDASNQQEPLKGVEYWLRALSHGGKLSRPISLIGSRSDRGEPAITREEIDGFCERNHISGGYVATSAFTGTGLQELMKRLAEMIEWDRATTTVTTNTFKQIKEHILELKEELESEREGVLSVLVNTGELRTQLERRYPDWTFTDDEIRTAIKHLANHGYVRVLRDSSGAEVILLAPYVLNNLAASFVLEARRNPKGLGAINENRLLSGHYDFPELIKLEKRERETLLDASTVLFLEHSICFRETLGSDTFLIFPALINQRKPQTSSSPISY